jgi:Domain of unknown function (DUF4386)
MRMSIRLARQTGIAYLGLAIAGALSFMIIRPQLFSAGHPDMTLAHLVDHPWLAKAGVAAELLTVASQALAAVGFYRLFRPVNRGAAAGIAAFGLVNAVMILISAAVLATAAALARDPFGDAASQVHLLYLVSGNLWGVAGLFFGLWLIPMGQCVLTSGWMPRTLGWILLGGGLGYVISTFVAYLIPAATGLSTALTLPATVAELWMIGHLLTRGISRHPIDQTLDQALHQTPTTSNSPMAAN